MRNKTIDFLRGVAVLLTLFRHFFYTSIFDTMRQVGWMGVDLFFVLSGFLVSGLIFDEYRKTNNFNGKQFLIRRGFKIYPAFWSLILCLFFYQYFIIGKVDYASIGHQLIFVQNYFSDGDHTWSLAIEEHFYFLIVILFLIIVRYAKNKERTITIGSLVIIGYGIIAKLLVSYFDRDFTAHTHLFPTHLRIDSLMVGLFIAHLSRTRQDIIQKIYQRKYFMYVLVVIGLIPPFIWNIDKYPEQLYISGIGLTTLSFSFGLLLILLLNDKNFETNLKKVIGNIGLNLIATIGFYSYSIYLWHILVRDILLRLLKIQGDTLNGYLIFVIYMASTISIGMLLGKLIEIPFLKLRERYFPKKA